jgi:hypothetical protein
MAPSDCSSALNRASVTSDCMQTVSDASHENRFESCGRARHLAGRRLTASIQSARHRSATERLEAKHDARHRGLFSVCLVSSGGPTRAKRTISEQRSIRVLSEQPDASHEKSAVSWTNWR